MTMIVMCQFAKQRSQNAQLFAAPFSLALWACGAPRQVLDMTSQVALSGSYSGLDDMRTGVLDSCRTQANIVARSPHMFQIDNMQISTSIYVEQVLGKGPARVITGTAMAIYPLRNATLAAMRLQPILDRQALLEEITFMDDIRPSLANHRGVTSHVLLHIIEVLLDFCPAFRDHKRKYATLPELQHTRSRPPPAGYKTTQNPLRSTTTAESSVSGIINVYSEAYTRQLNFQPNDAALNASAIVSINDQATNAMFRAAQNMRRGDLTAFSRMQLLQFGPGMFHALLNFAWILLAIHRGHEDTPGSLDYYIKGLQKKRHGAAHPDYHSLKATLMQVLSGLLLLAWEEVCGDLDRFAATDPSPLQLLEKAKEIHRRYATGPTMDTAQSDQKNPVLHNVRLLIRDLLYFRTLHAAVKSGDFGRVEELLGTMTILYCGAGANNYTTEFLHFIQNLRKVWTEGFA
jgi:hypothetical protein